MNKNCYYFSFLRIPLFILVSRNYTQSVTCVFGAHQHHERSNTVPLSSTTTKLMMNNESSVQQELSSDDQHIMPTSTSTNNVVDNNNSCSDTKTNFKTIYLIRHAESEENRRVGSLKSTFASLGRFSIPKQSDITAAWELCSVGEQIDSNVSNVGKEQIIRMSTILKEKNFLISNHIELIAHSPLIRAKETCSGLLGYTAESSSISPLALESSSALQRVIEMDILKEKTLIEWIPGQSGTFIKRINELEEWLRTVPENNIVLVGHSQFFKALLQLEYKFYNCDVYKVSYNPNTISTNNHIDKWLNLTKLYTIQPVSSHPLGSTTTSSVTSSPVVSGDDNDNSIMTKQNDNNNEHIPDTTITEPNKEK